MKRQYDKITTLGYVVFHRHGHRSPMRSIAAQEHEEAELWTKLLPEQNLLSTLREFDIKIDPANPMAFDAASYPFGSLTEKGLKHLIQVGSKVKSSFPLLRNQKELSISRMYATNYQRTQQSAQAFLLGLGALNTEIKVRDITTCSMSFFDGKAKLAVDSLTEVQKTDEFRALERDSLFLKKELTQLFPSLIKKSGSFDWHAAFDYFVCRESHSIPVLEQALPLSRDIQKIVSMRYSLYMQNDNLLRLFGGPMINDLITSINSIRKDSKESMNMNIKPGLILYSGHDINILGLLYLLKAPIRLQESFWPDYGSNIIFEVLSDQNENSVESEVILNAYYCCEKLEIQAYGDIDNNIAESNFAISLKELSNIATLLQK